MKKIIALFLSVLALSETHAAVKCALAVCAEPSCLVFENSFNSYEELQWKVEYLKGYTVSVGQGTAPDYFALRLTDDSGMFGRVLFHKDSMHTDVTLGDAYEYAELHCNLDLSGPRS